MQKFSDFQSLSANISDNNILFARDFKRGEIYYIGGHSVSSSRPAIIISNNEINRSLKKILVVYLTKKQMQLTSTRALILSTGHEAYALCEEISVVSIDLIKDYIGILTEKEMKAVDEAILKTFSLQKYTESAVIDFDIIKEKDKIILDKDKEIQALRDTVTSLTVEKNTIDAMYHSLLSAIVI